MIQQKFLGKSRSSLYKRRNIKLDAVEGSDESSETRMSLGENDEGTSGLSTGNSFLHDNVD